MNCEDHVNENLPLKVATVERGFTEDKTLHDDLTDIIFQNAEAVSDTHPSGTFARIFWESQKEASSLKES